MANFNSLNVLLLHIVGFSVSAGYAQTTPKPNIIFILTDDQRFDAMGYAGNKIIETPQMDRLAREGSYFRNSFCTTPISSASRASILTGLHERTHRYSFDSGAIREEYMNYSYPSLLHNAGYRTAFYGKFGVVYPQAENLFDEFENYDRGIDSGRRGYFYKTIGQDTLHLTRYTGRKAVEFLNKQSGDKPFCLSLSFSAPHAHDASTEQYYWDEGQSGLYNDVVFPAPDMSEDCYFNALPEGVRNGYSRLRWGWRFDTPEKYQQMMRGYYRMISGVDQEIGHIREVLKRKGLDKNTVIIFMGDNGYMLGERQVADKWLMYDLSIRVPMIIYDPRVQEHRDIEVSSLNIDIPSTIVDLAGVTQPTSWHGKSLIPLVSGKASDLKRDTLLFEHLWEMPYIPSSEGVRTSEWKYFRYVNDKLIEELYNLKNDPREAVNLASDIRYSAMLNKMRAKLDQVIVRYADPYSGVATKLTVEFVGDTQDNLINVSKPKYGWVVPSQAKFQKAYQIIISSSEQNANNNIGDIWNSGMVRSKKSVGIEHGGRPLSPNKTYYWRVRLWDYINRTSEYSEICKFTTDAFKLSKSTNK